jgi:phosphoglycolate phosphatase-like HAD superfamily hydrolase
MMFPDKDVVFWQDVVRQFEVRKVVALKAVRLDSAVYMVLRQLRERGFKIAVSSSTKQQLVEDTFAEYADAVDLLLGFREPDIGKGSAHFGEVLRVFGVEKQEVVFIGDSLNDLKIAREFGVGFVAKLGTFELEEFLQIDSEIYYINDISDLLNN